MNIKEVQSHDSMFDVIGLSKGFADMQFLDDLVTLINKIETDLSTTNIIEINKIS